MKQKLLLLLMLLLPMVSAEVCNGQGFPMIYKNVTNGYLNQIKYDCVTGNHIMYSTSLANENHFSLTDITNTTIDVRISTGYIIKDFEIFEDYVFFCGNTSLGEGLIGWFNINDLFYASLPAYTDNTLIVSMISELDDIEVYRDIYGKIHIAGLGSNTTFNSIGFEAMGDPLTGMQYRTSVFQFPVHDLTITDRFIVYAGDYAQRGITLYPFPKNDIFSSTIFHPSVYFQTTTPYTVEPDVIDNIEIIHTEGDCVATLSRYTVNNPFGINLSQHLALRTYKVNDSIAVMTSAYGMPYPYIFSTSRNIREAAYDPNLSTYYVLHKFPIASSMNIYAVTELDFSAGIPSYIHNYYSSYTAIPMYGFCLTHSHYYTVCGFDPSNHIPYYWQGIHSSPIGNCVYDQPLSLKVLDNEDGKDIGSSIVISGWRPLVFQDEEVGLEHTTDSELICTEG